MFNRMLAGVLGIAILVSTLTPIAAQRQAGPLVISPVRFQAQCVTGNEGRRIEILLEITDLELFKRYHEVISFRYDAGLSRVSQFDNIGETTVFRIPWEYDITELTITFWWLIEHVVYVPVGECPTALEEADEPGRIWLPFVIGAGK